VPEVWIVDLLGAAIEVYREPAGDAYALKERLTTGSLAAVLVGRRHDRRRRAPCVTSMVLTTP
jgi:Uma2 family endonuclease